MVNDIKLDLITIFPGIRLETNKWHNGDEVPDAETLNDISFRRSHIFSYKLRSSILKQRLLGFIDEMHEKIIDAAGNQLDDYTLIFNANLSVESIFEPPTSDAQQLLTYLSFVQNMNLWTTLDFIKIAAFHGSGRTIYLNNQRDSWSPKFNFLLQAEQNHTSKLRINKKNEKVIIDSIEKIASADKQTYERIINAMSLFNESCRISSLSPNSSIILIVSAIESLLDLPRYSKTEHFAHSVKLFWGMDRRIMEWARDLYELRSEIVHGGVVGREKLLASKDKHYSQFNIAREMFHNFLMFIVEEHGFISINRKFKFEVVSKLRNRVISNREKVDSILKQKNKFTYKAFVTNKAFYKEFLGCIEGLTGTDYSAQGKILRLLGQIFSISNDWIEAERSRIDKIKNEDQKYYSELKDHFEFKLPKLENIRNLSMEISKMKWSLRTKLNLIQELGKIQEEVRQLEPIVHFKNKYHFTISEFLDRSLRALFAIY